MRIWLMEIDALDGADDPVTLRFSTHAVSRADPYDVRIIQPARFRVSASSGLFGRAESGFGEAILANADGGLDYLSDYAVDGRTCRLTLVSTDETFESGEFDILDVGGGDLLDVEDDGSHLIVSANSVTAFLGTVQNLAWRDNTVSVILRDGREALEDIHPHNVYAGTNSLPDGVEGEPTDIGGRVKPKLYGEASNMKPVLVNTSQYIYQYHDGANVTLAYAADSGVLLTDDGEEASLAALEASTPASGHYSWFAGYFKVGAIPEDITCDAAHDTINDAGDVFEQIAGEAGYTVNSSDVTALNAKGEVRLYMTGEVSTARLLDRIAHSVGAIWWVGPDGEIRVVALAAPDSSPSLTIRHHQITAISREATGSGPNNLPIWRVRIGVLPIEYLQPRLATAASAHAHANLNARHRWVTGEDSAIKTRHPLASEWEPDDSCVRVPADGQDIADDLLALLKVRRDRVTLTAQMTPGVIATLSVGTSLQVITPRLGYAAGRNFMVIGYEIDAVNERATLELWG